MELAGKAGRPRSFDPDEALHRALLVFWEHGYEGTSVALLQEAMGLTAPQLYRAFESKERLFERAVGLYQERYGFGPSPDLSLTDSLTGYLERAAREFTSEPGRGCLVSTGLLATGPDARIAATVVRAEREQALKAIQERIENAITNGELDAGFDSVGLSRTIAALIQGMSIQARDGASREELGHIVTTARSLLSSRIPNRGNALP